MEKGKILIDFFKPEDNEALLDLSHRCVQHGIISVYPDRSPTFDRIHKQIDPESFHVVARHNGIIIGCVGAIFFPVQVGGQKARAVYMLDFKVDPDYQKGLTAYRLIKKAIGFLIDNDERIGFATIIKGNVASHVFTRGRAGFSPSRNLGDIQINNIIPLRRKKLDPRFKVENPSEEDIGEIVELYSGFYGNYKIAPYIDEEIFRFYIMEIEGMGLSNFWVAREKGRIKAILCSWDENIYKRYMVIKVPPGMRFVFRGISFLSRFFKMPASLKPGSPLRQKTLVMLAHDNSIPALKSLVRHVNNIHLGSEYTILQAHLHREDPLIGSLGGLFRLKVNVEAHMMTRNFGLADTVADKPGPVFFEWPVYI